MSAEVEKLVAALEWAVEWIDGCSSMSPDDIEAVMAIRALIEEVTS